MQLSLSNAPTLPVPFTAFLDLFPPAVFPLALGEDTYRQFETSGKLIPDALAAEYVAPLESAPIDEFTELLACARFAHADFVAVVYWKAALLHNHYRLATFDKRGNPIESRVVAGTYNEAGAEASQSAATITEERIVYVASAQAEAGRGLGAANQSSALRLAIDDSGVIRNLVDPKQN